MQWTILYEMGGIADSQIPAIRHCKESDPHFVHAQVLNHLHAREINAGQRYSGGRAIFAPGKIQAQWRQISALSQPVKIVTFVDDPVTINVNSYLKNVDRYFRKERDEIPVEEIVSGFMPRFFHTYPLGWFGKELQQTFGIDVYAHPFKGKVAKISDRQRQVELLIIRSDLDDKVKTETLGEFLDTDLNAQWSRSPLANNAETITIVPSKAYVQQILSSKMVGHFYTVPEIKTLEDKWCNTADHLAPS